MKTMLALLLPPAVALAIATPASAQVATESAHAASAPLSPGDRNAIVAEIEAAIREDYVFPEKTAGIVERLEEARRAGRYDVDDAASLAGRITADLAVASGDRHLYAMYDPARYAAEVTAADAEGEDSAAYFLRQAERDNSGLVEMKILPGNIRYLRIALFEWIPDQTGAAYDDAMRLMRGGDALIIDLRGNPGGDSAAVQYLVSHFLDPDTLEMTFLEGTKPPTQSRTLAYLPAGRIKDKPLYVLIDGNVGSAAESFAYDVQQFKLGELVGAKTVGGANNNKFVPIGSGLLLSVSYGRPVHAISGTNWEGVGVEPSVGVAPARALETAERLALLKLKAVGGAAPDVIADYDWALADVDSRLNPVIWSPARLQTLAGRYGEVTIAYKNGMLLMSRPNREARSLSPLTADGLFAVEGFAGMLRVRFHADSLETLWKGDPASRTYRRDPG